MRIILTSYLTDIWFNFGISTVYSHLFDAFCPFFFFPLVHSFPTLSSLKRKSGYKYASTTLSVSVIDYEFSVLVYIIS